MTDQVSRRLAIYVWIMCGLILWRMTDEMRFDILNYTQYQFMFQYLPPKLIFLRYCGSVAVRLLTVAAALGMIFRKDFYRKACVALSYFTALTIFWKHPYQAFVNANIFHHTNLDYFRLTVNLPWAPHERFYSMFLVAMMNSYVEDLAWAVVVIYFLSHPSVKKLFR